MLLAVLIVPSVAFASWWNPLTWKIFHRNIENSTVTINKVQNLKNENTNLTASDPDTKNSTVDNKNKSIYTKTLVSNNKDLPIIINNSTVNRIDARCKISMQGKPDLGKMVKAELYDLDIGISKYDIVWDSKDLDKLVAFNEANYILENIGPKNIYAVVTRKSDGVQSKVYCSEINVICENSNCPIYVKPIIDKIDSKECIDAQKNLTILNKELSTSKESYLKKIEDVKNNNSTGALRGGQLDLIANIERESQRKEVDLAIKSNAAVGSMSVACGLPINLYPKALCNDLTLSYSLNNSGTCSSHGGVLVWY